MKSEIKLIYRYSFSAQKTVKREGEKEKKPSVRAVSFLFYIDTMNNISYNNSKRTKERDVLL